METLNEMLGGRQEIIQTWDEYQLLYLDASGKDDIKEYLDFPKNPSAQKNSRGYVYSTNNQLEAVDGFCIPAIIL
jgi:hypothetical protein